MALKFEGSLLIGMQPEKHQITHFKGTFRSMLISLLLHAVFSHGHIIFESHQCPVPMLKKSLHFLNLGSSCKIISEGRGLFPIDCFIWSHFSGCMICCIVPPFIQRKPLDPLVLPFLGKVMQVCFQAFINYLHFPIYLRMTGSSYF